MRGHLFEATAFALSLCGFPTSSLPATVKVNPQQDATIFQNNANNSLGGGQALFAGTNSNTSPRRTLIQFDVASTIPAGSIVTDVELTVTLGAFAATSGAPPVSIDVHRVLAGWGEGSTGNGTGLSGVGQGFPASPGDATWSSPFFGSNLWTNAGGDFEAMISGSQLVGATMLDVPYTWGSTPLMVADVQGWLDSPASNDGWILLGPEATLQTARIFYSREASEPDFSPRLVVTFTSVPEPGGLLLIGVGLICWYAGFAIRVHR
jgi:hypothetical protein